MPAPLTKKELQFLIERLTDCLYNQLADRGVDAPLYKAFFINLYNRYNEYRAQFT